MGPHHQLIVIFSAFWITQCLGDYYSPSNYDPYYQVPVYYQYSWEVKDVPSGNDYRQQETRDGHLTTGLYQVLLPGGRHQTVNYRVDKDSGFMADVSYQGESNYFTFKSNYQPDQSKPKSEPAAYSYAPKESPSYSNYPPASQPAYDYQEPAAYYPVRQSQQEPSPYNYPQEEPIYAGYPAPDPKSYNNYNYPAAQATPDRLYYNAPEPYQQQKYAQNYRYQEEEEYIDEQVPSYAAERTTVRTTTSSPALVAATEPPATEWVTETSVVATEATPPAAVMEYGSKPDYSVPMYPLYRADFYSARAKAGKSIPEPQGGYAIDDAGTPYIKPSASYSVPDRLGTYEIKHRKATARKPSQSDYQAPEAIIQSKK